MSKGHGNIDCNNSVSVALSTLTQHCLQTIIPNDPTVHLLEDQVAGMFWMEAGLFISVKLLEFLIQDLEHCGLDATRR